MSRTVEIHFHVQNGSQKIAKEKTSLTGISLYLLIRCVILWVLKSRDLFRLFCRRDSGAHPLSHITG
jgi:hypothetical protein